MSDDTNTTGPRQMLSQLTQLWGRSPKGRKLVVAAVVLVVIGAIAWMTLRDTAPTWTVVGEGVSPDEAQELYAALVARDIPAQMKGGGVQVPADRASEARAIASAAGVLHGGAGLESFEETKLGQSAFAEQIRYRRALQTELARSIVQLTQIEGARVHLAFGKRSVFKNEVEPPTASVVLRLHAGQTLMPEQVRGIRQVVAASVDGMKPDGVVIVDNRGNLLDGTDPTTADPKAAVEGTVGGRVRTMLERLVGKGHVQVVVTAEMDTRKVQQTEEIFDKDHVIRSESRTLDGVDAKTVDTLTGGVAGTQGNLPGSAAPTTTGGNAAGDTGHIQETKNYEIGRIIRQVENPAATLQKLHVAVLVDQAVDAEGKPTVRTADEVAELTAIATQAAGLDSTRGDSIELRSVPFAPEVEIPAEPALPTVPGKPWWLTYAIGGGVGLIALIALMIVMKKRKKQAARDEMKAAPPLALPAPVAVLEAALDAGREPEAPQLPEGQTMHERVTVAARNDIERTAHILTSWLAEPAPKGAK